jgi:hypothetical protein
MKISKIRLVVLSPLFILYAAFVVYELIRYSPSFHDYLFLFNGFLCLISFSGLVFLTPLKILKPVSIMAGGLAGAVVIYYSLFCFYNPFVLSGRKLYKQPDGLYQIEYPSGWSVSGVPGNKHAVFLEEPKGGEASSERWNFSRAGIWIGPYFKAGARNSFFYQDRATVEIGGRKAEVRFFEDGGSTCTLAEIEVVFLSGIKGKPYPFVVRVMQVYNSDNLPNPHAVSPRRLLAKARPLLESFRVGRDRATNVVNEFYQRIGIYQRIITTNERMGSTNRTTNQRIGTGCYGIG